MILLFVILAGVGLAALVCCGWLSIDLLFGLATLTHDRSIGVLLASVVFSVIALGGMMLWAEIWG
jgi:hypothetical protein